MIGCAEALVTGAEAGGEDVGVPADEVNGDPGFSGLVTQNQGRVFRIACAVLGNAAEAEEIAQEAFFQAYRKLRSLRDPLKFRAWVARMAFRLALNRKRSRLRTMARDRVWQASRRGEADGSVRADDRLYLDELRARIEELPEKLRVVLLLCALEDHDAGQVAALLKIPVGTVRSRLHLARRKLLEALS